MNIGEEATIYLACFSAARDKASQWRDYADEGRGVCLCFKTLTEEKPEDPPGLSQGMTPVRYGADSWRPLLERCFRDVTSEYASLCKHRGGDKKGFRLVCGALYRIAAVLAIRVKDEGYSSEEEWRHASLNSNVHRHLLKLDMTNPRIPHINVQLRRDHLLAFEEIMLGPRQKTDRAVECAAQVLRDAGYSGDESPPITLSRVQPELVQREP